MELIFVAGRPLLCPTAIENETKTGGLLCFHRKQNYD
jgi:hypothetical protein